MPELTLKGSACVRNKVLDEFVALMLRIYITKYFWMYVPSSPAQKTVYWFMWGKKPCELPPIQYTEL